ncbi:MAG TPA: urea amidolyase associated protein UAAP1, partial [Polyangiaceae bacterium]|nr:urea amidolyase associated protein UAAP1 [Polyangiaceae bacterium]
MTKLSPDPVVRRESLRGGAAWSRRLGKDQVLRIVDSSGSACVSALFYNAHDPLERYNMADTLKAQFTAFLTKGRVLYSDMGRVLGSIVEDTCGWHDTIGGAGDAASLSAKVGEGSYQELRNDFHRNARDNFIVELSKHGLGKRDIVANVNFFVAVVVDATGNLAWRASNSRPGAKVEIRFEMDTLVV